MRAQVIEASGEPDEFRIAALPDPRPGSGEVVVALAATSVNPVDCKVRRHGLSIAPRLPAVLGCDAAGTVVADGDGVTGSKVGDAVHGCAGGVAGASGGTYAGRIAADARLLAHKPATLSPREAAALPLATLAAREGFDLAGGSDLAASSAATRLNGHVVTIVSRHGADLSLVHSRGPILRVVFMPIPMPHDHGPEAHGRPLRGAAALADAGKLRPLVDPGRLALEDLSRAHAKAEAGRALGRIVVDIASQHPVGRAAIEGSLS